jgi:heptosyltransferase-2
VDEIPPAPAIQLEGADAAAREGTAQFARLGIPPGAIGVSPGAAYGGAKRWLCERFAQTARRLQEAEDDPVVLFGAADERPLCEAVADVIRASGGAVWNLAGQTSLGEFIQLAAACRLFLTNDSGAMHIASALGVPTTAIFGATDDTTTGPTGEYVRVIRQPVECSPCLLRECPIDHRCMTGVTVDRVAEESLVLLQSHYGHT